MSAMARCVLAGIVSLVLMLGCTAPVTPVREPTLEEIVPGAKAPVAPVVTINCDTAFTPPERAELQIAVDLWKFQTSGLAVITLVYDVDFESTQDIKAHVEAGHNIMLRLESWMDIVTDEDADQGAKLLGLVSPAGGIHNPWQKPLTVGFVVDRLGDNSISGTTLTQVALHEFGHVLGVSHQNTMNAIMFPSAIRARDVCLKPADLSAFCLANVCGTFKMHPCE